MRNNDKAPTMADVARKAGVSVASVSNFVNGRVNMSVSIHARIAAAVEELGYHINSPARNLRSGRTGLLKLSIPDLRQVYFSQLAEDIITQARTRGYGVIVESTSNSRERELDSIRSMGNRVADGLILSPLLMNNEDIQAFEGNYPLVMLGERLFYPKITHVVIQNRLAAMAATQHLLDAGAHRIAVVGGIRTITSTETSRSIRTQGYRDALEQAGIAYDPELIRETEGWASVDGTQAVEALLRDGINVDAIFALNDLLAWGVLRRLRESDIRIPQQVQVVGFDNVDESAYTIPSLTTVEPGKRQIARLAVESIMEQVARGSRSPARTIEAPYSLVVRESSSRVESL